MKISKVEIKNFRNFEDVSVTTAQNLILVGANAVGKSNFIHALRLVLNSSLSRRDRMLKEDDFWRGNNLKPWGGREITVTVELSDFATDLYLQSLLSSYVTSDPDVARLTYVYKPKGNIKPQDAEEKHYDFRIYGGDDETNEVKGDIHRNLNLKVIGALRDANTELSARRLPLKNLLDLYEINGSSLGNVVTHIQQANSVLEQVQNIQRLEGDIASRLDVLKEQIHELNPVLRLIAENPEDVVRSLRILLSENQLLPISNTSLGLANLLLLSFHMLEVEKRESISKPIRQNEHEIIILAIEEPEAHLHPHLQRLLFRDFLRRDKAPVILSTHSPHIASVAPLNSILMLRRAEITAGTDIASTALLSFSPSEQKDMERYLDVSHAELLFARAVILVEGDAEEFLVPTLAKLAGYELDKYGVTICNIHGTNFLPYLKLVGSQGLNIPFIVLTDGDKYANLADGLALAGSAEDNEVDELNLIETLSPIELREELDRRNTPYYYGLKRCLDLLTELAVEEATTHHLQAAYAAGNWVEAITGFRQVGIFLNDWSFEPSLLDLKSVKECFAADIVSVLEEAGVGGRVIKKLKQQLLNGALADDQIMYWLSHIERVGKGRVAQRLSAILSEKNNGNEEYIVPEYINAGVKFIIQALTGQSTQRERSQPEEAVIRV